MTGKIPKVFVEEFLRRSRPDVFNTWPKGRLREWLDFHDRQRGLAVVEVDGQLAGVAVVWRSHAPDIDDPWTKWDDTGDTVYVGQLHSTCPAATLGILCFLDQRIPNWRTLRFMAQRRGRRVNIPSKYMGRLFTLSARKVLNEH